MTDKDRKEFVAYLRACTDNQIVGVYEKERRGHRSEYVFLVQLEAQRRGVFLELEPSDD